MTQSPRKFCIQVGGGVGDQVCAEPVIRYMINHWCAEDDFALMVHNPCFFRHLPVKTYDQDRLFPEHRLYVGTHPTKGSDPYDRTLSFQRVHPVDYVAMRLLRRTLPIADREIRLQVLPEARAKILQRLQPVLSKTVLIHPGLGWPSKTLPIESWDSYIDILQKQGYFIVIIGNENQTQTTLAGDWDTRNQLSMDELMALISLAPVLISNDSAPIHIAGAFDNWIGLIATCKDPSYVLPYRKGSNIYKAQALEKYKVYEENFNFDPLVYEDFPIAVFDEDLKKKIMPSADEILNFVRTAFL